jgi:integrase
VIPLPSVTPRTLRRTYISLMLEAGAPLHYVMSQVGHEDSKTTLEIYAHVQKRISRRFPGLSLMGTAGLEPATSRV